MPVDIAELTDSTPRAWKGWVSTHRVHLRVARFFGLAILVPAALVMLIGTLAQLVDNGEDFAFAMVFTGLFGVFCILFTMMYTVENKDLKGYIACLGVMVAICSVVVSVTSFVGFDSNSIGVIAGAVLNAGVLTAVVFLHRRTW